MSSRFTLIPLKDDDVVSYHSAYLKRVLLPRSACSVLEGGLEASSGREAPGHPLGADDTQRAK